MKLENFLLSETKWNPRDGIVAELEKPGKVDWGKIEKLITSLCGHCYEYRYGKDKKGCKACSLQDVSLCGLSFWAQGGYLFIYRMSINKIKRNKRKALQIARRIYKAILKDDPRGKEQ